MTIKPMPENCDCNECVLSKLVERQRVRIEEMTVEIDHLLKPSGAGQELYKLKTLYGIPLEHYREFLDAIWAKGAASPVQFLLLQAQLRAKLKSCEEIVEASLRAFAEQDGTEDFGKRVHKGCIDLAAAVKKYRIMVP